MTAEELMALLAPHDGKSLPVLFRCIAPVVGTVREVDRAELSTFAVFGAEAPCILLDVKADPEEEAASQP